MRRASFQKRLLACQRGGNMTVADLARWFDRPYQTVRSWVEQGIEPGGGPIDRYHAANLLTLLETLVKKKVGFPVPRLPPKERIAHLLTVRSATLEG
jgi:hypothetical protein